MTARRASSCRDLFVHELEDLVIPGFDPKEDPRAAGFLHLQSCRVIQGIHPAQAFPVEMQPPASDLLADPDHPFLFHREHIIGERNPVISQRKRRFDLVNHILRRALPVGAAEYHVAAELAAIRTAAGAHHRGDRVAILFPSVADVAFVGEQFAGGEGDAVQFFR